MIGAGEVLLLLGLVVLLYAALGPLRRRIEVRIARVLGASAAKRRGRVVVLGRRRDGTFGREDSDGG